MTGPTPDDPDTSVIAGGGGRVAGAGESPMRDHVAALRRVRCAWVDAEMDAIVEAAPPLTEQARARLAWLLRTDDASGWGQAA